MWYMSIFNLRLGEVLRAAEYFMSRKTGYKTWTEVRGWTVTFDDDSNLIKWKKELGVPSAGQKV